MLKKEVIGLYQSKLNLVETERAVEWIKDTFENEFAEELNLLRVSAPLFVPAHTGVNDPKSSNRSRNGNDWPFIATAWQRVRKCIPT